MDFTIDEDEEFDELSSQLGLTIGDLQDIIKGVGHCGNNEVDYFEQSMRSGTVLISPLHDAAAIGDIAKVKQILDAAEAEVDCRDATGNTPFMWAASCGRIDAMRLLLEHGADINAVNDVEDTSLHRACWRSQRDSVKFLLDHSINENGKNKHGKLATELIRDHQVALLFTVMGSDGDLFCHTDDDDDDNNVDNDDDEDIEC